MKYTVDTILRLAKRQNNTKRTYLLVNPLQGKHMPISPAVSIEMMQCLGKELSSNFPNASLVIGFAETATAIGAVVASCFASTCTYIHTTREQPKQVNEWIFFREEHSHAIEQKLCKDNLAALFAKSSQIIFVDDELSTGKTLINIVHQLRMQFPELCGKKIIAASIINRLTPENLDRFHRAGIISKSLLYLPKEDYTKAVSKFETLSPVDLRDIELPIAEIEYLDIDIPFPEPRIGIVMADYIRCCKQVVEKIIEVADKYIFQKKKILVLGTEECMFPALIFAQEIESKNKIGSVMIHATTRSPIGIWTANNYPINNGYKLRSFYNDLRETYIYNIDKYDIVFILSDAPSPSNEAIKDIAKAIYLHGCKSLIVIRGKKNV